MNHWIIRTISFVAILLLVVACEERDDTHVIQGELTEAQELINILSAEAVEIAQNSFQVPLDYSTNSIRLVEEVLARLHVEYQNSGSTEGITGLASAFGAYIGECIRRQYSGSTWSRDHPVGGEKSYPLSWGGGDSFPMAWCHRRIVNGPEDNVWHKFTVLAQQRADDDATKPPPSLE